MNSTNAFLLHLLSWQALLDIAIITAGLFFLYRTLAKLGTWKIFVGICLGFLLYIFASLLNLEGVEWIFQNISHVALIAMIVIFQPELRKILEKIVSLYSRKTLSNHHETSEIVAETLFKLAEVRCGALIVLPGRESLNDKISGGYILNANVSGPLIHSIFDHHSPGHDGAIILQNDKIPLFGVRLPSSQSGTLGEDYGTRHHAAMGISEQSDAIAFIVSEERATVSMFSSGTMTVMKSPAQVVAAITKHNQGLGSFVGDYGRNLNQKTIAQLSACTLIALIFWSSLVVVNRQIIEKVITVPVEYTSPNPGLVLVGDKVNEVKVHLTGSKADLDNLSAQTSVSIGLDDMEAGERVVLVTRENLRLPKNVAILDAVPAGIEIQLAEIVQKTVTIIPQLVGKLPAGRKIKSIKVHPETVKVLTPPDQEGNKPFNASTTPVYLNSIESSSVLYCKIIVPPSMQPVEKKWPDVMVTIELEE
jgi:diadenylate cyclase